MMIGGIPGGRPFVITESMEPSGCTWVSKGGSAGCGGAAGDCIPPGAPPIGIAPIAGGGGAPRPGIGMAASICDWSSGNRVEAAIGIWDVLSPSIFV